MFAIVVCLVVCTMIICSYVLCVLMVVGMSVVMNAMLSLMSVMTHPVACANYRCAR